jgi:hypothetical protein
MDLLIKYRNDRKLDGALAQELALYDSKIHAMLAGGDLGLKDSDRDLLTYRHQMVLDGVNRDVISQIDKVIYKSLSKSISKLVDVVVYTFASSLDLHISVDVNNSTVGDLRREIISRWNSRPNSQLIFRGRHLSNFELKLSELNLQDGEKFSLCSQQACFDNDCCYIHYHMMCSGMTTLAHELFKNFSSEEVRKIFAVTSKLTMPNSFMVPYSLPASVPSYLPASVPSTPPQSPTPPPPSSPCLSSFSISSDREDSCITLKTTEIN